MAITAIALASVARAQTGIEFARTYANPVIAFLSADRASQPLGTQHFAVGRTAYGDRANPQQSSGAVFWLKMLPVLFVGLLLPLGLLSSRFSNSLGLALPEPVLPALFQRPPPAQLL